MTFREVQLQDVLDIQWGDTKTTKASYVPSGYIAYSATGPDGFLEKFDYDTDGVVLSAIGANCGSTFYAMGKWSCIKNTIRIIPKTKEIDLKYFYYMTKAPNFWPLRGSAQPFISQTDIREMFVRIPEVARQKVIGQILHDIEIMIKANTQLSKTLEDIAQTIFQSWFIDFGPVKAKMAGEKPVGMDAATAALFPDSMEDSELGLIPKGWTVEVAENIFDISIGRTPPRKEPGWFCAGNEGVPWVSIRDMGTFNTYSNATSEGLTEEAVAKFRVPVVPEGTVLMSFKLTVGKLCISDKPLVTNEAIAHFVISSDSVITNHFTFLWLANHDMNSLDSTSSIGTATNSGVIKQIQFLIPDGAVLDAFSEVCAPIFKQIKSINSENTTLVEIRDSLLPRLISGELQIPDEMLAS